MTCLISPAPTSFTVYRPLLTASHSIDYWGIANCEIARSGRCAVILRCCVPWGIFGSHGAVFCIIRHHLIVHLVGILASFWARLSQIF